MLVLFRTDSRVSEDSVVTLIYVQNKTGEPR